MNEILKIFYLVVENIDYFAVLALTFIAAAGVVFAVSLLLTRERTAQERLSRLLPQKSKEGTLKRPRLLEEEGAGLVARITRPLHDIVAPSEKGMRKKIRLKMIRAGFRSEQAVRNFLTAKMITALLLPAMYVATRFFYSFTPETLLACITLVGIGFFLPNLAIWHITKERRLGIVRALPDALDLMVVCVEAGLGLDMTFKRVGEEIRPVNKDLSDEFHLTNLEVRAGRTRDEAFKNLILRTDVPEIHNLMTILIQTSRFGTSLAKALRVHADAMRVKRRQIAEEKAAKSTVKLIFPLVLFIFPAIFVVLIGPGIIRIVQALFPVFSG